MSYYELETMYSPQVPLCILESTETFLPLSSSDSHYLMIPEPSKPMMGNPSFLIPQRPRQKLRSEGLTGAYLSLTRNWPGCRVGGGQEASMGILPYFWICTTFINNIFIMATLLYSRVIQLLVLVLLILAVGAKISISEKLPALQEQIRRGTTHKFQVVQNQTWRYYLPPESKILSRLSNECHLHSAYIGVTGIITLGVEELLLQRSYSFNKNQKSIFELTDVSLTKYEVNWRSSKLTKGKTLYFQNVNCPRTMLQNYQDSRSFVFSCESIYEIDTNAMQKVGSVIERQQHVGEFKALRFQELIFEVSQDQGITVYTIDVSIRLAKLATITQFNNHTLQIADVFYRQYVLYVLDRQKGIFVFKRKHNTFVEFDTLSGSFEEAVNYKFIVLNYNNLFVAVEGKGESIVMECSLVENVMYLVRFYKGYKQIQKLSIFQNKLLIQSREKIQLLPINKDPRKIRQLNNGYTYTHDSQIRQLHYLQDNKFLIASANSIQIVAWTVKDSKLECAFSKTGSYSVGFESPCAINAKNAFFKVCGVMQQLDIVIITSHKDNYFWLLLIVGGMFIFGVIGLICWRHDRSMKIKKLLRKIKQFKERFQPKRKAIQFEEVQHAYSYNDNGKEVTIQLSQNENDKVGHASQESAKEEVHPYEQFVRSEREQLAHV